MTNKLKDQIEKLVSDKQTFEKEASELRAQLEIFEKRAKAEAILLSARETTAPDKLKAVTVNEFLSKRAALESKDFEHLEKLAGIVDLYESEGFSIFDEDDAPERGDLTSWLKSQSQYS